MESRFTTDFAEGLNYHPITIFWNLKSTDTKSISDI